MRRSLGCPFHPAVHGDGCGHAPEALPIGGDAARLEHVADNRLGTAVTYRPDGGPIRSGVARQGTAVAIAVAVADADVGLPNDAQAHPFERSTRRAR